MSLSIIKAEKISNITNIHIFNHEIVKVLKNKLKKTLGKMRSLNWHHIVKYYEILSKSLTKDFILKYRNYNHIK